MNPQTGYDRPTGLPQQSKSAAVGRHGMVASSQPLAVQAGVDILRRGGSAAEAAIAVNAVLGVVEPMSCGLGGDLFALYWEAATGKLHGLNASGRSPSALALSDFQERGLTHIPERGALSWSVPGCVDGWQALHARFGRLPWSELFSAAIDCAEHGFAVSEIIAADWNSSAEGLSAWPDSRETFLLDGRGPRVGQVVRNPRQAATLRMLATGGRDAFYRGPIAEQIVAFSQAHDGFFSLEDFAEHASEWVEPIGTTYRDVHVWELPPNGQGLAVLQILNLLEAYDLPALEPGHPDYLHWFVEAKKLAYADRARYYADPASADVPIAELAGKEYAARQRERIDPRRAAMDVPPGDPRLAHGDTVYLTVVDEQRNCCSLIQSNYYGFGSLATPGKLGFPLQNRGALFALDPAHPNAFAPRKRPFHTIIPAMALRAGRPLFCFGVMGGDMQPQGHVQVLVNLLDFGLNVQASGDAARIRHGGSATPTGLAGDPAGGQVSVESGISDAAVEDLRGRGHHVLRARGGYGGYQGIFLDHAAGSLHGGSDPRKDGLALGY